MLAGKSFHLKSDVLAIQQAEGGKRAFTIPSGSVIHITRYPCSTDDRMADGLWEGRPVLILNWDILYRAEEVKSEWSARI